MEDDLEGGTPNNEGGEGDGSGPSLIDTLDADFGFNERGEAAGATEGAQPAASTTGALPAPAAAGAAGAPAAGAAPGAAAVTDPAAAAAAAKPDPNAELYAPLPEHNPRRTHERFQRLVEGHKEEVTKREAAEKEVETFKGQIEQYEAGLQPLREMGFDSREAVADLQQFSQFRRALASGDAQSALRIMQPILQQLQLATGGAIDLNPLSGFPDLAQRVQVGELDQATAIELARSRHGQQVQSQQQRQQQLAQAQNHHQVRAIRDGAHAVNAAVVELMKSPDYAAVEPKLLERLEQIKRDYLPHQWAGVIKQTYDYERRLLLAAQQSQTQNTQPAPLRGNGHTGGTPVPKSAADAAFQALGM